MTKKIKNLKILQKYDVGVVYLFGSQSSGNTHAFSDIDIGIVFNKMPSQSGSKKINTYDDLYSIFCKNFKIDCFDTKGKKLDLVFLQEAHNPIFEFNAISEGKILYETSPSFRADYEENIMKKYYDCAHFQTIYNNELMKSLS